jgi:F-type H+-transporting ATPase subunit b
MDFSKLLHNPFVLEHPAEYTDVQWLIIRGIGFALVLFIILKYIWPSFFGTPLRERREAIIEASEQVEQTMRETEQMRNDYRARLERIEDETEARMQEAIREADALKDQILAEARAQAEAITRRGEEEISRERAKAMLRLRQQFVEDVINAAEFAAAGSLDGDRQRRLVDDFVTNVGAAR